MITIMTVMLQVTVMVCSHITVICLCFSNSQEVYTHNNCYDCYALSNSHGVLTHNCYLLCFNNSQDVYTHDNYYDCYSLSKTWCAHT